VSLLAAQAPHHLRHRRRIALGAITARADDCWSTEALGDVNSFAASVALKTVWNKKIMRRFGTQTILVG